MARLRSEPDQPSTERGEGQTYFVRKLREGVPPWRTRASSFWR